MTVTLCGLQALNIFSKSTAWCCACRKLQQFAQETLQGNAPASSTNGDLSSDSSSVGVWRLILQTIQFQYSFIRLVSVGRGSEIACQYNAYSLKHWRQISLALLIADLWSSSPVCFCWMRISRYMCRTSPFVGCWRLFMVTAFTCVSNKWYLVTRVACCVQLASTRRIRLGVRSVLPCPWSDLRFGTSCQLTFDLTGDSQVSSSLVQTV